MKIADFDVEIWMNTYETKCRYNISESCIDSITLAELMTLAGKSDSILGEILPMKMTYGAIEGSLRLRMAIASLYDTVSPDRVLVTHGAIGANALLYETLVESGDEIISVVPTYQQHYSIPESYGAAVKRLQLQEEHGFLPDLAALERLATPTTKLIALTNPNNPSGSLMDRPFLEKIVEIARRNDAYILCDEVYRGVNQDDDTMGASIADLYDKGISVSSMSKAFALAGLRLGWIAGPNEVLQAAMIHRDYNTISVGLLDDHIASIALEHRDALLKRNRAIVRTNLAILDTWVAREPLISYSKPKGGTVTLLKYDIPALGSMEFCRRLIEETGVMLMPGAALGMEGYVRIGFGNGTQVLQEGLEQTSRFLAQFAQRAA